LGKAWSWAGSLAEIPRSASVRRRVHNTRSGVIPPASLRQALKQDLARERIHKHGDGDEAPP